MRKWKVALLLLFSVLLSLCLFACKPADTEKPGDEEEPGTTTDPITRAAFVDDDNVITLTDAETADEATRTEAFNDAVSELMLSLTTKSGDRIRISGDKCDYALTSVTWGTAGTYYAEVTPKTQGEVDNSGGVKANMPLEIRIDHDFGAVDPATNEATCSHCKATRTVYTLADGLAEGVNYGAFHEGVENVTSGNGYGDLAAVAPFGTVRQRDLQSEVGSMTAGRLRKGMTITVTGTAKTVNPLPDDKQWYFPNIGIALRQFDASASPINPTAGYDGGMSVIVRNDGHVLMNGVGDNGVSAYGGRLLAGLVGSGTENFNYGSHDSATDSEFENAPWDDYDPGEMPVNAADWHDWSVYSTGDIMRTGAYTVEEDAAPKEIRLTWNFRTDNVVELIYENLTEEMTLTARIRIPEEYASMQFETVLHGDQVEMTFDSVTAVELEKLADARFTGFDADAQTVYAANEAVNFADIDDRLQVSYTKAPSSFTAYDGEYELQVLRSVEGEEEWVTLGEGDKLLATDAKFKIVISMGSVTEEISLAVGGDGFIQKIVPNTVEAVYGYNFTYNSFVIDGASLGDIGFTGAFDEKAQVVIPVTGNALRVPSNVAGNEAFLGFTSYLAMRIWGSFDPDFEPAEPSQDNPVIIVDHTADYLDVLVGVGDVRTATISGAQETDIVLDFTQVKTVDYDISFEVKIGNETNHTGLIPVNKDAELTVVYTLSDSVYRGGAIGLSSASTTYFRQIDEKTETIGGYAVKDYSAVEDEESGVWTVTVTYILPAPTDSASRLGLYLKPGVTAAATATNFIYYGAPEAAEAGTVTVEADGYTVYLVADGTDLYYYVASAYENPALKNGNIAASVLLNVNGGAAEAALEPGFVDIGFGYADGFVLNDASLAANGALTFNGEVYGTTDNDYDYDFGFWYAGVIDTTKFGVTAGSGAYTYYFQIGTSAETANTYSVTYTPAAEKTPASTAIAAYTLPEDLTLHTFREGSCVSAGLYGQELVVGGKVVFYANIREAGGSHSVKDGVCTLCGASYERDRAATKTFTLEDGEYAQEEVDFYAYNTAATIDFYHGTTVRVSDGGSSNWWWIRQDAFVAFNDYGAPATNIVHSLDEDGDTALRTPNGKLDPDGDPIDIETWKSAIIGGGADIVATFEDHTLTLTWKIYSKDNDEVPYFEFEVSIPGLGNTVSVEFGKDGMTTADNGSNNVTYYHGALANDMIASVGGSVTVNGVAFAAAGDYTATGIADGLAGIAGEGSAAALTDEQKEALGIPESLYGDYKTYVAFTVTFEQAYASAQTLVDAAVKGAEYAYAAFNADRTQLGVVIAYTGETTAYTIDLANSGAYTLQADIALDLSAVSAYGVTASVENNATFAKGGTVVITYTGVQQEIGTPTFWVNGTQMQEGQATDGVTFTSFADNKLTLQLPSFLTAQKEYAVEMRAANGDMVALSRIGATGLDAANVLDQATQIVADGNKVTLILTDNITAGTTKDLYVNANMGAAQADKTAIGWLNYGFTVTSNGIASFVAGADNAAGDTIAYYSVAGKTFAVLTLTLGDIASQESEYAYGVEISALGAAVDEGNIDYARIAVTADGTSLTVASADASQARAPIYGEHSCSAPATLGIAVSLEDTVVFYVNVEVKPAHSWADEDGDGIYECSECGALLYSKNINAVGTGDSVPDNGVRIGSELLGDITADGITISFWQNSSAADWDATVLATIAGNLHVTIENLQGNVKSTKPSSVDQALWDKLNNVWPANGGETGYNAPGVVLNKAAYVTIVVDPGTTGTDGVRYYVNGKLVINYAGDNVVGEFTIGEFVQAFLAAAKEGGLYVNGAKFAGALNTENFILDMKALTETEVTARYNNYRFEQNAYPTHVHVYDPDTDRCECGALDPDHEHAYKVDPEADDYDLCRCGQVNPDHGKTTAHVYVDNYCKVCHALDPDHAHADENADGKCDLCGEVMEGHTHDYSSGSKPGYCACGEPDPDHGKTGGTAHVDANGDAYCDVDYCGILMPDHEHAYTEGVCICGAVCAHGTVSEGVCADCGAAVVTTQVTENNSFDNPTAFQTWYDVPGSLTFGTELIISGTQTGEMAMQYHTVLWEIKQGMTGRLDNYGWTFDPGTASDDVKTAFANWVGGTMKIEDAEGAIVSLNWEETGNGWQTMREISKNSTWTMSFRWTEQGVIAVTLTVTAKEGQYAGYTYTNSVNLTIVDSSVEEFTFHLTGEKVTNFTVNSYTKATFSTQQGE